MAWGVGEGSAARSRGRFGHRRAAVARLLSDRDLALREAQGRLHAAEERIAELERELADARDQRGRVDDPGSAQRGEVPATAVSPVAAFVHEELGSILQVAQEAAQKIVERAEAESVEELAAARHVWEEIREQAERYSAWRSRAEPVIFAAHERVSEVQDRSQALADEVRESLRLLMESLRSMDSGLREVMGLPSPPNFTPPGELAIPASAMFPPLSTAAEGTPHHELWGLSRTDWTPGLVSRPPQEVERGASTDAEATDGNDPVAEAGAAAVASEDDEAAAQSAEPGAGSA